MSLRPGNCFQPVSLISAGALSVAPQRGQLNSFASVTVPHQGHVVREPAGIAAFASADDGDGDSTGGGWTGKDSTGAGSCIASGRFTRAPQDPQKFAKSPNARPQLVQNISPTQYDDARTSTGYRLDRAPSSAPAPCSSRRKIPCPAAEIQLASPPKNPCIKTPPVRA